MLDTLLSFIVMPILVSTWSVFFDDIVTAVSFTSSTSALSSLTLVLTNSTCYFSKKSSIGRQNRDEFGVGFLQMIIEFWCESAVMTYTVQRVNRKIFLSLVSLWWSWSLKREWSPLPSPLYLWSTTKLAGTVKLHWNRNFSRSDLRFFANLLNWPIESI